MLALEVQVKKQAAALSDQEPVAVMGTSGGMRPLCRLAGRFYVGIEAAGSLKTGIDIEYPRARGARAASMCTS